VTAVVRSARLVEMDPRTLYRLLRLRVDVFVVEQACAYPELDGRDLEPDAVHWWAQEGEDVLAALRVLVEPDGARRIGRVVSAPAARSRGLAAELMRRAIASIGTGPVVLSAQSHLEGWYARFGFAASGAGFLEDGIPHIPMRLDLGSPG
jgi:ElaA protein